MTVRMTGTPGKVEVITSVQRRRRWSAAEKVRMVEESHGPGASVSLVARRHGVNANQLFTWRRLAAHGACTAPGALDNGLSYAARLKACSCQAARMSVGLRWPFFSISHSAL